MTWISLLLFSCVSKGNHEFVEVQLDATRIALNARSASCYQEVAELEAGLDAQREELARLSETNAALVDRLDQQGREVDAARAELGRLLSAAEDKEGQALLDASAEQMQDALSALSHTEFQARQRLRKHMEWKNRFAALEDEGRLSVFPKGPRTVIRIPTKQIFNEGRVSISPRGEVLLKSLTEALSTTGDHSLEVVAHTDSRPYHTADYNSNWELAFAQAMTVLRTIEHAGIEAPISASSAAGTSPLGDNETKEGRDLNRRLELIIMPAPPAPAPAPDEEAPDEEPAGE